MTVMLSETVTHYHEVELSDELDLELEQVIETMNSILPKCGSGCEAITATLKAYQNTLGDAFEFKVNENSGGSEIEEIAFEYYC